MKKIETDYIRYNRLANLYNILYITKSFGV